jgi:RHS repeat-associated protein
MGCPRLTYTTEFDREYQSTRYSHLSVLRGSTEQKEQSKKTIPQSLFSNSAKVRLLVESPGIVCSQYCDYRYGFNGMEKDDEVKHGKGNSYTTQFRQYDPRLGRWLTLDPLMAKFPHISGFAAFNNNPILYIDPKGLAPGGPGKELPDNAKVSSSTSLVSSSPVAETIETYTVMTSTETLTGAVAEGQINNMKDKNKVGKEFEKNGSYTDGSNYEVTRTHSWVVITTTAITYDTDTGTEVVSQEESKTKTQYMGYTTTVTYDETQNFHTSGGPGGTWTAHKSGGTNGGADWYSTADLVNNPNMHNSHNNFVSEAIAHRSVNEGNGNSINESPDMSKVNGYLDQAFAASSHNFADELSVISGYAALVPGIGTYVAAGLSVGSLVINIGSGMYKQKEKALENQKLRDKLDDEYLKQATIPPNTVRAFRR